MIQKYFFLVLMLVSCIANGSDQIDSIISDLKLKSEILQDSVAHLLQQTPKMQQQLKDLMSKYHPSQKKIAELEMMINTTTQSFNQLLPWKDEIDNRVNRFKSVVNMTVLRQHLQPINLEIQKLKNDLETFSQKETALEVSLKRQMAQMQHIYKEFKGVKDKLPSIEKVTNYLNITSEARFNKLQLNVDELRKKHDEHEKSDREQDKKIKTMDARITSLTVQLRKLAQSKKP